LVSAIDAATRVVTRRVPTVCPLPLFRRLLQPF
jgi:hypothetical protein